MSSAAFRRLLARVRALFASRTLDDDFEREAEAHLALLAQEHIRRGMTADEARRAAAVEFGGVAALRERHRDARGLPAIDTIVQDLRYTFRTLRRDAAFTTFAILIVGLGIGASATIFSVVNAVLLRPLPFQDPGQLVWIRNDAGDGLSGATIQSGYIKELIDRTKSFSQISGYYAFYSGGGGTKLTGADGEPERVTGVPVSVNFFATLGVQAQLGAGFTPDQAAFPPRTVIITDRLWKRRFASDPGLVGRALTLDDRPVTVVGILPATFDFTTVFAPGSRVDLFFPLPPFDNRGMHQTGNALSAVARMKPGVSVERARAEVDAAMTQIKRDRPTWNTFNPRVTPLEEHVSGRVRPALFVLACAVAVVMLIVCANLSNLLVARTSARQKEMAVRAALGAGRGRLVRQMLTESLVLSGLGALLGLALAVGGTGVVSRLDAFDIPLLDTVRVDAVALAFITFVAVLTGIIFGLAPALQVPSVTMHGVLKETSRGTSGGRRVAWIRGALVVSEVAFACVLLVCAGLLIRSFLQVLDVNIGFHPERAAAVRIDRGPRGANQAQRNAHYGEVLRRVREVPGVESAGLSDVLPYGPNRSWSAGVKGRVYAKEDPPPDVFIRIVSDGYLKAMGIPLIAGRDFTEGDALAPGAKKVVLINQTLARTLFPNEDPIGKTLMYLDPEREVIGVVGDVRHLALEEGSGGEAYLPMRQTEDYASVELIVRSALPPASIASAIRGALTPIEPTFAVNELVMLQGLVDKAVSPRRFVVMLLAAFSAFALMLASLGIYGVISYTVDQRRQEMAIRLAFGASVRELRARIVMQTMRLAAVGMIIGFSVAWIAARAIGGLLFNVTATDPITFAAMLGVLTVVAVMAGYLPARRVSRIDPAVALRAS
jgi:predicted permease